MSQLFVDWISAIWMVLAESGPYLLVGFVVAGLLAVFVPSQWVARKLGGNDVKSVGTAAVIGVPVPLCSCSVIPTATQLRRSGASRGATTSFLISTPETGVDSIGATWALMDPLMTIVRPVAAFMTAFAAGIAVTIFGKGESGPLDRASVEGNPVGDTAPPEDTAAEEAHDCCAHSAPPAPKAKDQNGCHDESSGGHDHHGHDHDHSAPTDGHPVSRALRYGFGTLLDDLTPWFIVGFALSGLIVVAVPDGFFTGNLFSGWTAMLAMLVAGVPLYVCATASTPIAAAMMVKGLDPGAALVFLLAGPATNIATMLVVRDLLGKRVLAIYLISIAFMSIAIGLVVSRLYPFFGMDPTAMDVVPGGMQHGPVATISGAVLAILLARSAWRLSLGAAFGRWLRKTGKPVGLDPTALPVKLAAGALLAAGYATTALTVVGPGESVFVERFGRVVASGTEPGLLTHLPWPFTSARRVTNTEVRTLDFGIDRAPIDDSTIDPLALRDERQRLARLDEEAEVLTGDELLLSVRYSLQYRVTDAEGWLYGWASPEDMVGRLAQDALRRSIARLEAETVLVGNPAALVEDVEANLQADLNSTGLGVQVVAVLPGYVHAPAEVHDDYRIVASAIVDRDTEITRSQTTSVEILSEARMAARDLITRASREAISSKAAASGVQAAFAALVDLHAESPEQIRQLMLNDSLKRAARPPLEGGRRVVLRLGDDIELVPTIAGEGSAAPLGIDEILNGATGGNR